MSDRELLEAAAKAAGMPHTYNEFWSGFYIRNPDGSWVPNHHWNPLTNSGDAFELAVKLGLGFQNCWKPGPEFGAEAWSGHDRHDAKRSVNCDDPYAASRIAIVRAAAAIGKEMK